MSWPFDTTEPYVTPAMIAESQRLRAGLTPEEWALPPTLVATFQGTAHKRLLARAGLDTAPEVRASDIGGGLGTGRLTGSVEGVPVVVTRISVGAPAAVIVLEESIARGVRNILVVGAAGSLQPHLPLGSTVLVEGAEREDGTSHHYLPAGEMVSASPELTALLEECAIARGTSPVRGRSWTIDAPFRETVGAIRRHREAGVAVVEMEAAAIFAVAQVRGVRAALIVVVSDELFGHEWQIGFGDQPYLDSLERAADVAMDAAHLG